jgi:hypothetical protein
MLNHSTIIRSAIRGPWDNGWPASLCDFTYIAKDENSNIYKIGKSNNLRARILAIRNSHYFLCLDYKLIAFAPGNIESIVQESIIRAGGLPIRDNNHPRTIRQELFRLDEEDVNVIIESFLFQRAESNVFPTGYKFSRHGSIDGYVGKYDITGWVEKPIKRIKKLKSDGND